MIVSLQSLASVSATYLDRSSPTTAMFSILGCGRFSLPPFALTSSSHASCARVSSCACTSILPVPSSCARVSARVEQGGGSRSKQKLWPASPSKSLAYTRLAYACNGPHEGQVDHEVVLVQAVAVSEEPLLVLKYWVGVPPSRGLCGPGQAKHQNLGGCRAHQRMPSLSAAQRVPHQSVPTEPAPSHPRVRNPLTP